MAARGSRKWLSRLLAAACLLGAAESRAATSKEVYAQLLALPADSVLGDYSFAIHGTAATLIARKTANGELTTTDPVFRIAAATGDTTREYRTYFDLYRATIETPGNWQLEVQAITGNAWMVRPVVVPIIRVLSPSGEVLAKETPEAGGIGAPGRKAMFQLSAPGECFVFVGADNSDPGSNAGYEMPSMMFTPPGGQPPNPATQPLASKAVGRYWVRLKPLKKR